MVEPEIDEAQYRMRQELGSAEIEGEEVEISINIDGQAVFFDFVDRDERVMYHITDLLQGAYELVIEEEE